MTTAAEMMEKVRTTCPLVHHITNYVTVNDCANVCICAGGSPVMTDCAKDVPDMVKLASAVVLNIGTLNERTVESMYLAGLTANKLGIPVILDPVGVGATQYRTVTAQGLMKSIKISVIKGNQGEISVLAGLGGEVRGVDSVAGSDDVAAAAVKLAKMTGAVVAATGPTDYISDGENLVTLSNGSEMLATVSGTGCMVSSIVGAYVGACGASVDSVAAAISVMCVASEIAISKGDVSGPGTFKMRLLDSIYSLKKNDLDTMIRRH